MSRRGAKGLLNDVLRKVPLTGVSDIRGAGDLRKVLLANVDLLRDNALDIFAKEVSKVLSKVDVQRLDALVRAHTLDGAPRPALAPSRLNGLFKGFIDLVFEFEGRYYVADYKSNWLGGDAQAYHAEAMRQTVLEKRYDLQYVLYLLALHRQLKARLPGYDYARHMGGVLYLYLRGVDGDGHGVHRERLPFELIDALDGLFARGELADAHV